jgi:AraC-like DNA-binding protein
MDVSGIASPALAAFGPVPIVYLVAPGRARGEVLRQRRLQRIEAHIDANIADPALSARRAARALGMSVRLLHLTLAPSGESFGQLVQRRRMQACYALLCRPGEENIAQIAFACGFNSLSSFYRAFRRIYGASPRDLRAAAAMPAVSMAA